MGFFDLFRKRPQHPQSPVLAGMGLSTPRSHHYRFAYSALPKVSFEDAGRVVEFVGAPDKLVRFWHAFGKTLPSNSRLSREQPVFTLSDTQVISSSQILIVVRMPKPQAQTEAFFVGVVMSHAYAMSDSAADPQLRYFVLSSSGPSEGTLREITRERPSSFPLTYDVPATIQGFADAIQRRLATPRV